MTTTSGAGSFSVPSGSLGTTGATTVTVTSIAYVGGTACSSSISSGNTSTFTVNPLPVVSGFTPSTSNICVGNGETVNVTSSLADATYTVTYNLSGANSATRCYCHNDYNKWCRQLPCVPSASLGTDRCYYSDCDINSLCRLALAVQQQHIQWQHIDIYS